MSRLKLVVFIIFSWFTITGLFSQSSPAIDSLQKLLRVSSASGRPELLNKIAEAYTDVNPEKRIEFGQQAYDLARKLNSYREQALGQHNIAKAYATMKEYDKALSAASKMNDILKIESNPELQCMLNILYSFINSGKKDYQKALEFAQKALSIAEKEDLPKQKLDAVHQMVTVYYYMQDFKTMGEYAIREYEIALQIKDLKSQANALNKVGIAYYYQGDYEKTLTNWEKQLGVLRLIGDKKEIAQTYNNIGVIYKKWGKYQKAIECFQENLKIQEQIGDTINMARAQANIGNVYFSFAIDYNKALEYYEKGIILFEKAGEIADMASVLNSIGLIYKEKKDVGKALDYFRKSLKIQEQLKNKAGIAQAKSNLAGAYLVAGNYNLALNYCLDAIKIAKELDNKENLSAFMQVAGMIYSKMGANEQALQYFAQSSKLFKEMNMKRELLDNYKSISQTYEQMGSYNRALDYFKEYSDLKDSTLSEENLKVIKELETKYETEKKEKEIQLLNTTQELQKTELKRQRIFIWAAVVVLIIILVFSAALYKQFSEKKKANILLEAQNVEIKNQRDQIYQQKKEITDSIHYASRIQNAILPPAAFVSEHLPDHFILFKPRDIVSGDFYWMAHRENISVITVADCTGHGVPGAFMSMLGVSLLSEIFNKMENILASEILNQLRLNIVRSLHQTGKEGEAKDGMDISLCVIDHNTNQMQFAGAYNPLYLIRNNEVVELKADRMPIGIHAKSNEPFTNNIFDLQSGDTFYMLSDGFIDQFGGETGKKFMAKRFKEVLLSMRDLPMILQRDFLDETIEKWKGDLSQVDDILVIGVKVS